MVLFFDRSVGTALPVVLRVPPLRFPDQIEYHQLHFPQDEQDDSWLPVVGSQGWVVVGHDIYLKKSTEIVALKQHNIGCFRMWGAHAKRWEKLRCFLLGYEAMVSTASSAARPFIFEVSREGKLRSIPIP